MRAVRDRYPRSQRHAAEIVNKRMLGDSALVSGLEVPWEINRRGWIHMNTATKFCSETAKQKSPPAETRPRAEPKKRLGKHPQHAPRDLARRVFPGATILFNLQHASPLNRYFLFTLRSLRAQARHRASIHKPSASVRQFEAMKILFLPNCDHDYPWLVDRHHSFRSLVLDPPQFPSGPSQFAMPLRHRSPRANCTPASSAP